MKHTLTLVGSATVIGVLAGVLVIGVEHLVEDILHEVQEAEPWATGAILVVGADNPPGVNPNHGPRGGR